VVGFGKGGWVDSSRRVVGPPRGEGYSVLDLPGIDAFVCQNAEPRRPRVLPPAPRAARPPAAAKRCTRPVLPFFPFVPSTRSPAHPRPPSAPPDRAHASFADPPARVKCPIPPPRHPQLEDESCAGRWRRRWSLLVGATHTPLTARLAHPSREERTASHSDRERERERASAIYHTSSSSSSSS
jgi:hypothetical protein